MPDSESPQMREFIYTGPTSGMTLRAADGSRIEQMLFNGETVSLPVDHAHVQRLIAQGFLQSAPAAADVGDAREPWPPPGRAGIDTAGMTEEAPQGTSTPAPETRSRRRATSTENNS